MHYNWVGLHGTLITTKGMVSMKVSIDSKGIRDVVDAVPLDIVGIATTRMVILE